MRFPLRRIRQAFIVLFIPTLTLTLLAIESAPYRRCRLYSASNQSSIPMISYNLSSNIENERSTINSLSILCLDMGFRLDNEKFLPQSPVILAPSFNSNTLHRLPYR